MDRNTGVRRATPPTDDNSVSPRADAWSSVGERSADALRYETQALRFGGDDEGARELNAEADRLEFEADEAAHLSAIERWHPQVDPLDEFWPDAAQQVRDHPLRPGAVEDLMDEYARERDEAADDEDNESELAGFDDPATRMLPAPSQPMEVARVFMADNYTVEGYDDLGAFTLYRWRDQWWQWDTTRWVERDASRIRAQIYRFTENATYIKIDKNGTTTVEPWAPTRNKVLNVLDALGAVTYLRSDLDHPEWIDNDPGKPNPRELVSCGNGLLHVPTRTLYPHSAKFFNLTAVPFGYQPNADEPTVWFKFIRDLWPDTADDDSIAALGEFMGYIVSGRSDFHKILLVVGPKRGGKGTIAHICEQLVGKGNHAAPTLSSLSKNFGLAPLIGKPLAIVPDARFEAADNKAAVVERLLSISGGDVQTIDIKYNQQWTGQLPVRFVILSNELPRFGDASGAIASRFVTLTLTQSWIDRENHNLLQELLPDLPGILNWSLDGLDRLIARDRFQMPKSSEAAMRLLYDLASPTSAFLREECRVEAGVEVSLAAAYARWKDWAHEHGHEAGSAATFGKNLHAALPGLGMKRYRRYNRERYYQGLRLLTDHEQRQIDDETEFDVDPRDEAEAQQ
jgi:putative DNA primase/helicase